MKPTDKKLNTNFKDKAQPTEGQKDPKSGKIWSDIYGGYVPGLYAQGR